MKLSFKKTLTVILALLALTLSAIGVTPAHAAATLTVNTLEDNITNGDGLCTLREAIVAANFDMDFHDCTASSYVADRIVFSVSGTITLGSTLPTITAAGGALTINGSGQTITISGNNLVRVLQVDSSASLTVQNLTIANGSFAVGGGIFNNGTLAITNSTFSGNSASGGSGGGIVNADTLTITNSTFSGNNAVAGGGIVNTGTLTITNSAFSGNSASSSVGGGITNAGTLTITNSTFSGNSANWGGGINNTNTLIITNSTFSGNSAVTSGGGIFNSSAGTLTVTNNTFSGNTASSSGGGGIFNAAGGSASLLNTIVANNTGENCIGTITNGGNNIDDGTTCNWGSSNGSMSTTIALLGPLADNGGPTQTMALLVGSPAIDGVTYSAPNHAPTTDQRGVARPIGGGYDIGAYEFNVYNLFLPLILR